MPVAADMRKSVGGSNRHCLVVYNEINFSLLIFFEAISQVSCTSTKRWVYHSIAMSEDE